MTEHPKWSTVHLYKCERCGHSTTFPDENKEKHMCPVCGTVTMSKKD